jgi:hypothetical protein
LFSCSSDSASTDPSICNEIKTLKLDNKILCTDECSDNYLTCVDDSVVENTLAQGEKCYENGIVLTSEGSCVLARDMMDTVVIFNAMDACTNYPDLEYCSTIVEPGGSPYTGTVHRDGTWMFKDQVTLMYIEIFDEDGIEHGWRIYITIRFAHDQELGRSRSVSLSEKIILFTHNLRRKLTHYTSFLCRTICRSLPLWILVLLGS